MRTFLALPVPDALTAPLLAVGHRLPVVRPVAAENLHLTLHFLGDVPEAQLEELCGEIARKPLPGALLKLDGVSHFEGVAGGSFHGVIAPDAGLTALHDRLKVCITRAGLPFQRRRFRPHVTLARFRGLDAVEAGRVTSALSTQQPLMGQAAAERLVLYRSHLRPSGAEYEELIDFPLGT